MKFKRMNIRIQRSKQSLVILLLGIVSLSFFLLIIPGTYSNLGLLLIGTWIVGLYIISESHQESISKHRRQNYVVLVLFLLFILLGSSAAFRIGIDKALRPPVTHNDLQASPISEKQFTTANNSESTPQTNSTDSSNGTLYIISLSDSIFFSDSVATSAAFRIVLSDVIVISSGMTIDANDQYFQVLYDAANNSFKKFHAFSKKLVKRIFKRIKKKTKKLRRLEQHDDTRPALKEYMRVVDEAIFLEKILY